MKIHLLAIALAISAPAQAGRPMLDGPDFVAACKAFVAINEEPKAAEKFNATEIYDAALCQGFVTGVMETVSSTGKYENGPVRVCLSGNALSNADLAKGVVKMADERPDLFKREGNDGTLTPAAISLLAMYRLRPCK